MIGWLVKMLTGGTAAGAFGPWLLLGAVVVIGGAGFTAGNYVRGVTDAPIISHQETLTADADKRTAQCVAKHEATRADGAEKVISALGVAAANVTDALNVLAQKAAARGKSLDQFLKDIANAPPSKVCGGSASELAYRRSVVGVRAQPAVTAATP